MPQHIEITRRIAADNLARAQHAAHEEERLSSELTDLEKWAKDETQRIQDALEAVRKKAESDIQQIQGRVKGCHNALVKAGRDKANCDYQAREALESVKDWCVRAGINMAALPPLPHPEPASATSGPLPTLPSSPADVQALLQAGQHAAAPPATDVTLPDAGGDPAHEAGFRGEAPDAA
jgi:hypothetical protein